jgi:hypothetical protein
MRISARSVERNCPLAGMRYLIALCRILTLSIQLKFPRFGIYRVICNMLEGNNRMAEALESFRQMQSGLQEDTSTPDDRARWELSKVFHGRRSSQG